MRHCNACAWHQGVWVYTIIIHRWIDVPRRKDYYVMFIHHVVTIALIGMSPHVSGVAESRTRITQLMRTTHRLDAPSHVCATASHGCVMCCASSQRAVGRTASTGCPS